jgi:hypothetical protein
MISTATTEVMRLVSLFVRRLDSELVESAARNAESSVLDQHRRRVDEVRTLNDLHAIQQRVEASTMAAASRL